MELDVGRRCVLLASGSPISSNEGKGKSGPSSSEIAAGEIVGLSGYSNSGESWRSDSVGDGTELDEEAKLEGEESEGSSFGVILSSMSFSVRSTSVAALTEEGDVGVATSFSDS